MYGRQFWIDAGERILATFVGTLIVLLTTNAAGFTPGDFKTAVISALGTALFSFAKALVAGQVGDPTTASLASVDSRGDSGSVARGYIGLILVVFLAAIGVTLAIAVISMLA